MDDVMQARSIRFAATARALGEVARAHGFEAPAFRSPPRVKGRNRTIVRHASGAATVAVVVRGRPWSAVVADMIDGFVACNTDGDPERLRDLLWGAIESVDLRTTPSITSPPVVRAA